ncbi:MAG: hypothetical protein M1378_13580, partial [Bacteroidetes bacterium]|nr:hypothetical protein [Bacteroidota bacterium]
MNLRIKYVRLSAIVALLFLILMFSEVRVRLEAAAAAFTDLKAKEKSLMTPNEIRSKKKTLLIERE